MRTQSLSQSLFVSLHRDESLSTALRPAGPHRAVLEACCALSEGITKSPLELLE